MPRTSEEMRERLLDLGWSLWTGLGVPGQIDNHRDVAIDPEPLILFTAALGDADPRLRDEATDWCIRHGSLISGTRLRNLLVRENKRVREAYGEFAGTVAAHSSMRWPGRKEARPFSPRFRPPNQTFERPSQIALRLRGMMGVGARADIVQVVLGSPDEALSAAYLAAEIGYSKRNIAQALEALRIADVVQAFPVRNQIRFRLSTRPIDRGDEQISIARHPAKPFGEIPRAFVRWPSALHVLTEVIQLVEQVEEKGNDVRAVEAMSVIKKKEHQIRSARFPVPRDDVRGPLFWDEFTVWLSVVVENLSAGNEPVGDRFRARWRKMEGIPGGEVMERGAFQVSEDPRADGDCRWALVWSEGSRARQDVDDGVRYSSADDAKRFAETKQLYLDRHAVAAS
jgi:biotin operon repressor